MTTPTADAAMTKLLLTMMQLATSKLRDVGDDHWAAWLQQDHDRIAAGDVRGLAHVKQAFGGMGSINDMYPSDDPEIGTHLAAIYRMASQLLANIDAQKKR